MTRLSNQEGEFIVSITVKQMIEEMPGLAKIVMPPGSRISRKNLISLGLLSVLFSGSGSCKSKIFIPRRASRKGFAICLWLNTNANMKRFVMVNCSNGIWFASILLLWPGDLIRAVLG